MRSTSPRMPMTATFVAIPPYAGAGVDRFHRSRCLPLDPSPEELLGSLIRPAVEPSTEAHLQDWMQQGRPALDPPESNPSIPLP